MATVTGITVGITPLTGGPITLNVTDGPAAGGGTPSAIDHLTVSWSRPSGRDHQAPGDISMTITSSTLLPPLLDALVEVTVSWDHQPAVLTARGWVESATRTARYPGLHTWDLTLIDAIGRAAATRLAADPWPLDYAHDNISAVQHRLTRIQAAAGTTVLSPTMLSQNMTYYWEPDHGNVPGSAYYVVPRDVDSVDALSIIERTGIIAMMSAEEGEDGVVVSAPVHAASMRWPTDQGFPWNGWGKHRAGQQHPIPLASHALESSDRLLSRRTVVTAYRMSWSSGNVVYPTGADPTVEMTRDNESETIPGPPTYRTTAAAAWETDLFADIWDDLWGQSDGRPVWMLNYLRAWLDILATPVETLAPLTVVTDRLTTTEATCLTSIATRARPLLELTPSPPDVDPWQLLTAGTLTLTPDGTGTIAADLTITLEPAILTGIRLMRWGDLPTRDGLIPADRFLFTQIVEQAPTFARTRFAAIPPSIPGGDKPITELMGPFWVPNARKGVPA